MDKIDRNLHEVIFALFNELKGSDPNSKLLADISDKLDEIIDWINAQ